MDTTRITPLGRALFGVIVLAAPLSAAENAWTTHGPVDVGWVTDVAVTNSVVYASTLNGVFISDDDGTTWEATGLPGGRIDQVLATGGDTVLARSGWTAPFFWLDWTLQVSRDRGQTWEPADLPPISAAALDPDHRATVYAAVAYGKLARSTNAGGTWQFISDVPGDGFAIALAVGPNAIYALTAAGLYRSVSGGAPWTRLTIPAELDPLDAIALGESGALYAVGGNKGRFCRSLDAGTVWNCSSFPGFVTTGIRIIEVPGNSPSTPRILATSSEGLLSSRDGGATWTQTRELARADVAAPHGLAANDSGSLVLAGSERGILRSADKGDTWTAHGTGLRSAWIDAVVPDAQGGPTIWAGGSRSGLFRSQNGGLSWSAIDHGGPPSIGAIAVDPARSSTIYIGSDKIYRSDDGGATWTRSSSSPSSATSLMIDPVSPQRLWAVNGGLYKSEDGARTWRPVPLTQSIFCALLDPRHDGTIYAGSYFDTVSDDGIDSPRGGGVFVSRDRGATFAKNVQNFGDSVIAIVPDPFHEDGLYAATSTRVFQSADRGATWTRTRTSPPRYINALLADPKRPGHVYVSSFEGVYRSTDGGQTWSPFKDGLSHTPASALAFSPDGNRLHAGTWGAGAFSLDLEGGGPSASCIGSATRLCLVGNRYALELEVFPDDEARSAPGSARSLSDRAGYFGFPSATGDPDLPEVVVKMLPDGAFGGKGAPVFYSSLTTVPYAFTVTDTVTGEHKEYRSNPSLAFCGGADLAFSGAATLAPKSLVSSPASVEVDTLRLLGGRFTVTLEARVPGSDATAPGAVLRAGDRLGFFSLPALTGDPQFPEIIVKMVDARSIGSGFWFFHSSLTSLQYTITVRDTVTGAVRLYRNGAPFCGGADTGAFSDSPPATGLNLTGAWTGTISFPTDCFQCPSRSESIAISLFHTGSTVSGIVTTECLGRSELRGTLQGDLLRIDFWPPSGTGDFEGSVTSTRIDIRKNCDPWGYGDDLTQKVFLTR
jgi:photosystem II stability/assembly factor-like uncharacterized protein